jgi:hypothetical protein
MNLDRMSYVTTVSACDLPVNSNLPLPPFFNTAPPCGRFWIDGRLPCTSDVPAFPSTSSGPGNKILEGELRLSVVG